MDDIGSGLRSEESVAEGQRREEEAYRQANPPPTPEQLAETARKNKEYRMAHGRDSAAAEEAKYTGKRIDEIKSGKPVGRGRAANVLTGNGSLLDDVVSAKRQLLGI